MKLSVHLTLAVALVINLSGCAYNSAQQQESQACKIIGPKTLIGAVGGAAAGAAIGAAAGNGKGAAIGAGVGLLAGVIAGHIADRQDCEAAQKALAANLDAVRNGDMIHWTSQSGHQGAYRVTSDSYAAGDYTDCRNATSIPPAGSSEAPQQLMACRTPTGDYKYFRYETFSFPLVPNGYSACGMWPQGICTE